jgi:hypothetical protein
MYAWHVGNPHVRKWIPWVCLRVSSGYSARTQWKWIPDRWYVQNVSTFPNIFAVVSPLICVFWIQLTRTNVVFSRIALVSRFCAEIQLSVKIQEKLAKNPISPEDPRSQKTRRRGGTRPPHTGGAAQPWPRPPVVRTARPSPRPLLPPTYTLWPKNIGGYGIFPR